MHFKLKALKIKGTCRKNKFAFCEIFLDYIGICFLIIIHREKKRKNNDQLESS